MTFEALVDKISMSHDLHGFFPSTKGEVIDNQVVVLFENRYSREKINVIIQCTGRYFRIKTFVGEGQADFSERVFQENRRAFLAGLSIDSEGKLWSEAVLLSDHIEHSEAIDATRSVIAVSLEAREKFWTFLN